MAATLSLPEELLLLCLDDEKGTVSPWAGFGITGAVLIELIRRDRLAVTIRPPKRILGVTVPQSPLMSFSFALTGDEVLDGVLEIIGQSKRRRSVAGWVSRISSGSESKRLISMLVDRLVQMGILLKEEHRVLWVIPVKRYPAQDERAEDEIVVQLRRVLLEGAEPDERTAALIGFANACGVMRSVLDRAERRLDRAERRAAGKRAKEIAKGRFRGTGIPEDAKARLAAVFEAVSQAIAAASSG